MAATPRKRHAVEDAEDTDVTPAKKSLIQGLRNIRLGSIKGKLNTLSRRKSRSPRIRHTYDSDIETTLQNMSLCGLRKGSGDLSIRLGDELPENRSTRSSSAREGDAEEDMTERFRDGKSWVRLIWVMLILSSCPDGLVVVTGVWYRSASAKWWAR